MYIYIYLLCITDALVSYLYLYIYIVCILHLYIICIACLNEIYDITFHIVRTQSWCVLIHYMCYLSEWDVYDLFVISSIWGGGAAPSPQPPSSFFKPSQAKPFLGPAPHAVSTTAGSYHWMLSRKPCQQQKKMQTQQQTIKQIGKIETPMNINKKLQELMKKEEQQWKKHATTNEKQGKPCKNPWKTTNNHAKTNETPWKNQWKPRRKLCKNQWKPRRNNENKCIHHTYPAFMYHLYSCLNDIYDITFHIVRIHSWCVLIHYICYLSEGGHEEPKK